MKLNQILAEPKPSLSFEVFPPKSSDSYENIRGAAEAVAALAPSFISVTYGAGGGTSAYTVAIAAGIQEKFHVPALAHLSCIHSTRESVHRQLDAMANTIALLRQQKPDCLVVVGGAVLTQDYADRIGADRYARNAMETVRYAEQVFHSDAAAQ